LEKKNNKELNGIMQEWCLEYKNVDYYSFSLKALNGEVKGEEAVNLKIKKSVKKNSLSL
jgi:hypothetical protein